MSETTYQPTTRPSKRDQERDLDSRASGIDTHTQIGERDSLRIILRSAAYIRFFFWRYIAKFAMKFGAYAVALGLLPWPAKMLVDHVILANPISEATDYPPYWMPVVTAMQDAALSPMAILVWLVVIGLGLVLLIGRYTTGYDDDVEAGLAQGHDYATQVENTIHGGHSTFGGLWGYVEFKINARLNQALNHTLRAQLFSRIGALSVTQLEDQRIGDSIYRVMYDAPQVQEIFYEITHTPVMSTVLYTQALITLLVTYPTQPQVFWITMAMGLTYMILSGLFSRVVRRRGQAARSAGALTTGTIEEGMDNVAAVQSLGGNVHEQARFEGDSAESFKRFRKVALLWMIIPQVGDTINALAQTAFFVMLIGLIVDGALTPGDFGAMFVFWGYLRGPAMALGILWIRFQDNVAAMRRVFAMMDLPAETDLGTMRLPPISDGVAMRGAGLVYPDGRRALEGIDLDAKVGQIVAFVGPTGAGKTSLAYLIPRYHVASEGEILIDGHNINDVTLDSLRGQITYVFQETQLFSDSIRDNIRYGKPEASQEEVEQVARTAGIHDFIASLPEGYDTKLGSSAASKLSVGQKQRISIARGLLRDSRVLILDEPTSALDPETEQYLVASLHEAAKDRLVIIIAHRLSTIAHADKIVFLQEGRVMEQGSHDELLAREGGYYRAFVELQTSAAA